jgi:hypothetical protein
MSNAATAWARQRRTGDTRTSFVLRDLADRANAKGECWPTTKTIADDTEQSISSVKRCLAKLEQQNFIARIEQLQYGDSGKWSSALTIVLYNDAARKNALKRGWMRKNTDISAERDAIRDDLDTDCSLAASGRSPMRTTDRGPDRATVNDASLGPIWTTDRGSLMSHENHNLRTYPPKAPPSAYPPLLDADRGLSEKSNGESARHGRPGREFVAVDTSEWDAWCAFEGKVRDTFRRQIHGIWTAGAFFPSRLPPDPVGKASESIAKGGGG